MSGPRLFHTAVGITAYLGVVKMAHMGVACMKESPSIAANHSDFPLKAILSDHHVKSLKETGLVVIDHVLTAEELKLARGEVIKLLDHSNEFCDDPNDDLTVRSDSVMWISEKVSKIHKSTLSSSLMQTLRMLRAIPNELVSLHGYDAANLGVPLSNQLACYDGKGSNYIAHRDAPAVTGILDWILQPGVYDREITMVLYLNEEKWDSSTIDGENCDGNLRCFLDTENDDYTGDTAKKVVNIEPVGGRLVIFDSKRVLHAVLPTSQRRIALTSWIGGSHSKHEWLRTFCIPFEEIDWSTVRNKIGSAFSF